MVPRFRRCLSNDSGTLIFESFLTTFDVVYAVVKPPCQGNLVQTYDALVRNTIISRDPKIAEAR